MKLSTLSSLTCYLAGVLALQSAKSTPGNDRVLYFLDNDPSGDSVVSIRVSQSNGTLSSGTRTSTGGIGIGFPQGFALSQDSVVVSGNV
jgi:hypothetical protein